MAYTQEHRTLSVETPLGKDVLLLRSFSGSEEMSRLFTYDLDMLSEKASISAKEIVGKNVSFAVKYPDGSQRYFNGHVSRFSAAGRGDRLHMYKAQVVPWLWFLTRKSDCKIFQNKTVPEIIKQVFSDAGFNDFQMEVKGNHPQWEYCVQYRETDFNFVSRLMEHEGIFFFFKHEQGKHTLVMADSSSAYKDCKDNKAQINADLADLFPTDLIHRWDHHFEFTSGKWAHTDYNFETATTDLKTQTQSVVKLDGNSKYEFFDYPGEYEKKPDGEADVKNRMEEEEAGYDQSHGESYCRSFSPGGKFKVTDKQSGDDGKGFVITSVRHNGSVGGSYVTNQSGEAGGYGNYFVAIPDSVTYRPPRITPKPLISGIQTALVVGPKGEEIYTDKYGRIKVQFYWDRYGKKDEKSSCWIRVAQGSAGRKWGAMFIPRIGQEVVVEFLEGDPDRPLITGVVYNSDQMPGYDLPGEMTKSYIKTNTTKGGEGFNELRFDDKKGKEQIFVHCERNMDVRVKHDSMERIIGDRHQIIGEDKDGKKSGDQREKIYQDQHLRVLRNQIEHIDGNIQLLVGKGEADDGGNIDLVTEKDRKEKIGGDDNLEVVGSRKEKVDGDQSLTVGGDQQEKIGGSHLAEAVQEIHLKAGMKVVIEAGVQLTLQGPGGFVDISPAGVVIQGLMVLINSGGAPGVGTPAMPTEPDEPEEADPTEPDMADDSKSGQKSCN